MRTFTYNAINSINYFYTHSIERQVLPPVDFDLKKITGKAGAIPGRTSLGVREIEVEVSLYGDSWADLRTRLETEIAPWLYQTTDKQLIFSDEPNRVYNARLSGDTNLEELIFIGTVKLKFICSDPYKYNTIEKNTLLSVVNPTTEIINTGTAPLFPRIRMVPTGNQTTIKIQNDTVGKYILLHNITDELNAWKIIISDNSKNLIYNETTGARQMNTLDLTSDFFPLVPGSNIIRMEPYLTGMSARVYYKERYL